MITIEKTDALDPSFFEPRDFGDTSESVKKIIRQIREKGDSALHEMSCKFDVAAPSSLQIKEKEIEAAAKKMQIENPRLYESLVYSHDLAVRFALQQKDSFNDFEIELEPGLFTGQKTIPVKNVGVYVPAGRFPLVSTVIMTVSPAIAAGVENIVFCTPPRVHPDDRFLAKSQKTGIPGKPFIDGKPYADEGIMAAAYICGIKSIYACGGAQAVAAMAYGTATIPVVDVIVGPGNKYVTAAKQQVFGKCGIDLLAGPTEVFIIADNTANPVWVAADMLAQAEHDVVAQPILATNDRNLAEKVQQEIENQLSKLSTVETARKSIDTYGKIILTDSIEQSAEIANSKAPEHLELAMTEGEVRNKVVSLVHNYGSLFIGHSSAEVFGDYAAGLNHTLPTSGAARFTGGLSVRCFLKTVTTLRTDVKKTGVIKSAQAAGYIGDAEGLAGHAHAARLRIEK